MKANITQHSTGTAAMRSLFIYFSAILALFSLSTFVFAAAASSGGDGDMAAVAEKVTSNLEAVGQLITAASYIAGIGFALMGLLKLKAHKDNPTQVPLSQPIVLLAVAAGLVFLPSIIKTAGATLWEDGERGGTKGDGGEDMWGDQ